MSIFQMTICLPAEDRERLDRMMVLGRYRSRNELASSILHAVLADDEAAHGVAAEIPRHGATESIERFMGRPCPDTGPVLKGRQWTLQSHGEAHTSLECPCPRTRAGVTSRPARPAESRYE
jgi:hypothetical protein